MSWNYERVESEFERVPEGEHRIRIRSVEKTLSAAGNEMLKFEFNVSGMNSILFHYIVFLPDKPKITNSNLSRFFDSFADIPDGNFNLMEWVGKAGAALVEHDGQYDRIKRFIPKSRQDSLPPWKDTGSNTADSMTGFVEVDDDLPF